MRWLVRAFGGNARAPRDVDATLRSALLAVLDRNLDEAESLLTRAVRIDSTATEPYQALARLYRARGEIGRAIRIHQNLLMRADLRTEPGVSVLADLAEDFRRGGFLRRAIASYREVVRHDPRHRRALQALVDLLSEVRDFEAAIGMERRLARLERRGSGTGEARLRVAMAQAARAEGRGDDALRAVKQALRKDRQLSDAWIVLGELESERGRVRSAVKAWKRASEIDRNSGARVYPRLAAAYASLDRAVEYENWLRQGIEGHADDVEARLALARSLAGRGDAASALDELRRGLERHPENLELRGTLGRILLSEHRDPDAIVAYAELLDVIERGSSKPGAEHLS